MFIVQFKRGIKYGLIFMLFAIIMGFMYGIIGGQILRPTLAFITIIGIFASINFAFAMLALVPFLIWKKKRRILRKYIGISFGFVVVYFPLFILLKLIPMRVF